MNIVPEIASLDTEMRDWRHHIHAHPETAFEETATSAFVADKLEAIGLDVHTGLAKTGVVGVLRCGGGSDAIGLRADLDALHIPNARASPTRRATKAGCTPAVTTATRRCCSGAAKALARRRRFDGTVYFIFQPAEENEGGGRVMVEEGLFDRFPMRAVYGMHNWPRKPLGTFAMRAGPLMGAYDIFEIVATGKGAHAAMAYLGKDPMLFVAAGDQCAADDRLAQPPSARRRRGQRDAGARRRHLERDSAGSRAARHRAHVRSGSAGPDRAADAHDRRRRRGDVRDERDGALRASLSRDRQ